MPRMPTDVDMTAAAKLAIWSPGKTSSLCRMEEFSGDFEAKPQVLKSASFCRSPPVKSTSPTKFFFEVLCFEALDFLCTAFVFKSWTGEEENIARVAFFFSFFVQG